MLEESVYCRMLVSGNTYRAMSDLIHANKPPKGLVVCLSLTEKQFANMDIVTGEYSSDVLRSTDKVVDL